jgi:hypothetical protein
LGGCFLNGALDEVVVFNRALSPAEIAALFDKGKKGQPAVAP